MNKVCDIHTHVVYGVDDGAYNLDMSMQMLRSAAEQGVTDIICTSHSGSNIHKYFQNLEKLKNELMKENININLHPGCEIYCDANIVEEVVSELKQGAIPTINNTNYILVEFTPHVTPSEIMHCVSCISNNGYKIIVAHVERYQKLFKDDKWISCLHDNGCLFQVNAYSLYDEVNNGIKSAARKLLTEKMISFIGSDAHTTIHRSYMIKNGVDYIKKYCDSEYCKEILYKNTECFLNIK